MIIQQCQSLNEKLKEHKKLLHLQGKASQLKKIEIQLHEINEEVQNNISSAKSLSSEKILVIKKLPPLKNAAIKLSSLENVLAEDPLHLTDGKDFYNAKKTIENFNTKTKDFTREAWKCHVKSLKPDVQLSKLRNLASKDQASLIHEISSLLDQLHEIESKLPQDRSEVLRHKEIVEKIVTLRNQIRPENLDPEVDRFFDEVNKPGGVNLDLLTDSVRQYLKENGEMENYRINPKSRF